MKNPKASTDRDFNLVMALKTFDENKFQTFIYQIENGAMFQIYNGKKFIKIKKRRTRFECKEVQTGKIYVFKIIKHISDIIDSFNYSMGKKDCIE